MEKHIDSYGLSWLELIVNVIVIVGCALGAMHIAIYLGFPAFLSFIPMLFGIAIGILIAGGIIRLAGFCACRGRGSWT